MNAQADDFHHRITRILVPVAMASALLYSQQARGQTILTNYDEVSVKAAVAQGGIIRFERDGIVHLTSPLSIRNDTTLDATGRDVTLSGNGTSRILNVQRNVFLRLLHLKLANGHDNGNLPGRTSPHAVGGAILNEGGTLNIEGCTFTSNRVTGFHSNTTLAPGGNCLGGDIYSPQGRLNIINSKFEDTWAAAGTFQPGATGGSQPPTTVRGGSIWIGDSALTLSNVAFSRVKIVGGTNGASFGDGGPCFGGVIYTTNSTMDATDSRFSDYSCTRGRPSGRLPGDMLGGALYLDKGTCRFSRSAFQNNGMSSRLGGAVYGNSAFLFFASCSFSGNGTQGYSARNLGPTYPPTLSAGGAVYAAGSASSASFQNCSFFENTAIGAAAIGTIVAQPGCEAKGGAIYSESALQIINSTFQANAAVGGIGAPTNFYYYSPGGDAMGGAIYSINQADLRFSTFAGNTAVGGKGHGYDSLHVRTDGRAAGSALFATNSGVFTLSASILAHSTGASNSFGPLVDAGFNLSSDLTPAFTRPDSRNGIDPRLGVFGDYGGPTPTIPLLAGSPAIDAATTTAYPFDDQRGRRRPRGTAADIGAFEQSLDEMVLLPNPNSSLTLSFFGDPTRRYNLEASGNLATWTAVPADRPSPGALRTNLVPTDATRFYRTRSQP